MVCGATYPAVVYVIEFDGVFCKAVNSEVSVFTITVCESTADLAILNAVVFNSKVAVAVSKLDRAIFFSAIAIAVAVSASCLCAIATVVLSTTVLACRID